MKNDTLRRDARIAYETLRAGGLVLLPTDVGYGLVAMEERAVRRLYDLKGRPLSKPCITVANDAIFDRLVLPVDVDVRWWLSDVTTRVPLAVVTELDPHSRLLASMSPYVRSQATQSGTIATFLNAGALVQRVADLAFADGRLVVGSSANLSGTGNNYTFDEVPEVMRRAADVAIDRGPAAYANEHKLATTILDLRTGMFQRKGVAFDRIERSWNENRSVASIAS